MLRSGCCRPQSLAGIRISAAAGVEEEHTGVYMIYTPYIFYHYLPSLGTSRRMPCCLKSFLNFFLFWHTLRSSPSFHLYQAAEIASMARDEKDAQGKSSFCVNQQYYVQLALFECRQFVSQPPLSPDLMHLVSLVCCGQRGISMPRRFQRTTGRALAVGHSVRLSPVTFL